MQQFLKVTLIETLSGFRVDIAELAIRSGVPKERIGMLLSDSALACPSEAEYRAILKALPLSLLLAGDEHIHSADVAEELEYVAGVVGVMAGSASDDSLPLLSGLQRHIRRIVAML